MPVSRRTSLKLTAMGLAGLPLLATTRRAEAAAHLVEIKGFKFRPQELQVEPGDTVFFRNLDGAPHTATAENGAFDTGRIDPGKEIPVEIPGQDAFVYRCQFHPNMVGRIVAG